MHDSSVSGVAAPGRIPGRIIYIVLVKFGKVKKRQDNKFCVGKIPCIGP